jgi:hypothetical protein
LRRLVAAGCVVAIACAPKPTDTAAPVPTSAPTPAPQSTEPIPTIPTPVGTGVRFGPGALRYVVRQHVRMEHDKSADMPAALELGWSTFIATTVTGPAVTSGYPTIFTVDSIKPDSGVMLPPWINVGLARGLRITGHLAPTGEFVGGRASDSTAAENLAMLLVSFQSFYPRIPVNGVNVGDSWSDTLTLVDRGGNRVTTRRTVRQTRAVAWEETTGGRVLRLEVSERYELSDQGTGGGQPFHAKGTGVTASVERLGAGGRFLGTVARDSSNLVITLTAQGVTIPRRQITTTTVTVLP